jgi:glycerophosphoryl diester phosphodiesterase
MRFTSHAGLFTGLCWSVVSLFTTSAHADVLAIGHRGNSLFAPENTVAAFKSALGKADLVEFDGQLSQDGVLMIMHDTSVTRTTDGTGNLTSLTTAQLKTLDAGSWFSAAFAGERVPTLEEALTNIIPAAIPLIERKGGAPADYVAVLRRLNALTNVVVQAFDWVFLAGVRDLEPRIPLCALGSGTFSLSSLISITNAGARIVAWEKTGVTASMVELVHGQGLQVFVWTVDGPEIKNFIDLGVDGIISNDPGMVRQLQQSPTNNLSRLLDDLLTYWKLDDGVTNALAATVLDSVGTNSATLIRGNAASPWLAAGFSAFEGAIQLAGSNAWISMPRTDIGTNELTLSGWFKLRERPSQMTTTYGALLDSTTDCYVLYLDKANKELRFKVTDVAGHAARPGIPEALLPTNEWIHVAATYSGRVGPVSGQACIYLNGQPQDVHTGNDNSSPFGLTGTVKPGQNAALGREGPTGASYFFGGVDDLAFWRRALSAAEVAAIYRGGSSGLALGDLLRRPTGLIVALNSRLLSGSDAVEIEFQSLGEWTTFRLLRAAGLSSAFVAVPGISPTSLGNGRYRFVCPVGNSSPQFFRIEGQ